MPQYMAKEGELQVPSTHVGRDSCICMAMTAPAVGYLTEAVGVCDDNYNRGSGGFQYKEMSQSGV